jgi:hypothetical protein
MEQPRDTYALLAALMAMMGLSFLILGKGSLSQEGKLPVLSLLLALEGTNLMPRLGLDESESSSICLRHMSTIRRCTKSSRITRIYL